MSSIISMLIALLLFFAGAARADIIPLQITNDLANQGRPDVAGNTVVWKDLRHGNWDIFMYDLGTNTQSPVIEHPAYQNLPATNGQVVVWQDDRAGTNNNDIYFRDVAGGAEHLLVSGPGNQGVPAISGNLLTYVDDRSGNNDIYVIDIETRVITPICTNAFNQWQPRISGHRVVWEDNRNGSWDIYMYDMDTHEEKRVSSDPGDDRVADISDETVVWQHLTGAQYDIWLKDMRTDVTEAITSDTAYQNSPRISGDLVVWENYNYGNPGYDIYMKDLTSHIVAPLANTAATEGRPALDGETVVWESTVAGNYDVWMTKVLDTVAPVISSQTPAADTQADCTAPSIFASYTDNRIGVDTGSVRMSLDGNDVTADAQISQTGVTYQPSQLPDGNHQVELRVSDKAGNERVTSWGFSTVSPNASLSTINSWWATYDDFLNHDLSVQFRLRNTSSTHVAAADVMAATATQGVLASSEVPVGFGPIQPGASADATLKYRVPPGIMSFKTVVYLALTDSCGVVYEYPGPPPGW